MIPSTTETITIEACSECQVGLEFSYDDLMALEDSSVLINNMWAGGFSIYYHGDHTCQFCGSEISIAGEVEIHNEGAK